LHWSIYLVLCNDTHSAMARLVAWLTNHGCLLCSDWVVKASHSPLLLQLKIAVLVCQLLRHIRWHLSMPLRDWQEWYPEEYYVHRWLCCLWRCVCWCRLTALLVGQAIQRRRPVWKWQKETTRYTLMSCVCRLLNNGSTHRRSGLATLFSVGAVP